MASESPVFSFLILELELFSFLLPSCERQWGGYTAFHFGGVPVDRGGWGFFMGIGGGREGYFFFMACVLCCYSPLV